MTEASWDDYVATDPGEAVDQVQDNVNDLADTVNSDPDATLPDELNVIDAQSSADAAVNDQTTAGGFEDQGNWEADQAQQWADYAEGSADQGLGDLAESASNTAAEYAASAGESFDNSDNAEADVASDLQDVSTSESYIDESAYTDNSVGSSYDTSSLDTSIDDTSSVDTSIDDTSSVDTSVDSSEY